MLASIKKGALLLFLVFFPLNVFALVRPTSSFYVNDYANVLSSDTKNYIVKMSSSLDSKTKAQIVVVTVNDLEGSDIETYATDLFRSFGIGDKKENNGILILLSKEDRKVKIEVGYGLEGDIPDGKAGRILDNYMVSYLKENNYDEGIKNGYNKILEILCTKYNVTLDGQETPTEEKVNPFETVISILFFLFLLYFMMRFPGFWWFTSGGHNFRGGSSFGGGGFSGGGGSSGGGGASRGF